MADDLGNLLRAADVPDPERAEEHWAAYRAGGSGADDAVRALLAWYGRDIYRRIWGLVRSDAAEDVFQEVLERLHRHRGRLSTWADARRWVRRVCDTASTDHLRREARRKRREARRAVSAADATPPDGHPELSEAMAVALSKLSPKHRRAIALVVFEGLTVEAAAKEEGVSRDTLAAWRDAGLARLRELLPAGAVGVGAGTAGVEAALAAGRPVVTAGRLGELAGEALRGAARSGPTLGKTAVVVLVGLTLGGVGLAGWAMTEPVPEPVTAQVPPPRAEVPAVERETLPAQNLRILKADVLPKLTAAVSKLTGGGTVTVTETWAEGTDVFVGLESSRPLPTNTIPLRARLYFCVLSRRFAAYYFDQGTRRWRDADPEAFVLRPEFSGRHYDIRIPYRWVHGPLGIREAFEALPADPRAVAEFARFHLDGTPFGGPELILPWIAPHIAGTSRYLFLEWNQHLLVRDAAGGFVGWRWAGSVPTAGIGRLAANDAALFSPLHGATDGQIWTRPATPDVVAWRPFCRTPPGRPWHPGSLAATGDRLFAFDRHGDLWSRPAADGPSDWTRAGRVPAPDGRLMADADRLYFLGPDGRTLVRPADGGGWEPFAELPWGGFGACWAGRMFRWQGEGAVLSRTLDPGPADWVPAGRVHPTGSFLNWRP